MLNGISLSILLVVIMLVVAFILTILANMFLAPIIKTPKRVISEIIDRMNLKQSDTLMDLGCGEGRILLEAYKTSKCKCLGYDISPIMIIVARTKRILSFPLNNDVVFELGNVFETDFKNVTKIYCYLDEKSLKILKKKFGNFISNGGRIYSYKYEVKGLKSKKTILNNGETLYIYEKRGGR